MIESSRRLRGDHCRCSTCGGHFNSTYAFDKHRTGDWSARRCLSAVEMVGKGMVRNARGFWVSHAKVDPSAPGVNSSGDRSRPPPLVAPGNDPWRVPAAAGTLAHSEGERGESAW
jgi:hypothetical protein